MTGKKRPSTHQGDDLGGLGHQTVRKLFIELDQVANVDVAIELLEQGIFAQLISISHTSVVPSRYDCQRLTCR